MEMLWTTDSVGATERLSYWADAVCRTYVQLDCDAPARGAGFHGAITAGRIATLGLSRVRSSAQRVRRTPVNIARASEDYFLVNIQATGSGMVLQDGRVARLRPGDFAIYDSTRPYELHFDADFEQLVLQLPGAMLRERLPQPHVLTARAVSGERGAAALAAGTVRALARQLPQIEAPAHGAIAESIENLLLAGLATLTEQQPRVTGLAAFHRDQIKALALSRLGDPRLSVTHIARHLRLSPSTVHRAFADEPASVMAWIWSRRLDAARRDLCDPRLLNRSVSEIAFAWGFNDAAHFSRSFRARFSCSPRDVRPERDSASGR